MKLEDVKYPIPPDILTATMFLCTFAVKSTIH